MGESGGVEHIEHPNGRIYVQDTETKEVYGSYPGEHGYWNKEEERYEDGCRSDAKPHHEQRKTMTESNTEHPLPHTKEALSTAVFEALGAASTCWETLENAGVFQDGRATAIGEELLEKIGKITNWTEPHLGLATTEELADELSVRLSDAQSSHPYYRTINND